MNRATAILVSAALLGCGAADPPADSSHAVNHPCACDSSRLCNGGEVCPAGLLCASIGQCVAPTDAAVDAPTDAPASVDTAPTDVPQDSPNDAAADVAPDGVDPCDRDGDGHRARSCGGDDCDDSNPRAYPTAPEWCDGIDENCDGVADVVVDAGVGREHDPGADTWCVTALPRHPYTSVSARCVLPAFPVISQTCQGIAAGAYCVGCMTGEARCDVAQNDAPGTPVQSTCPRR